MSNQTLIEEYPGIISEIQTEIKKLENDTRVLNKLYVILDVLRQCKIFCGMIHFNHTIIPLFFLFLVHDNIKLNYFSYVSKQCLFVFLFLLLIRYFHAILFFLCVKSV